MSIPQSPEGSPSLLSAPGSSRLHTAITPPQTLTRDTRPSLQQSPSRPQSFSLSELAQTPLEDLSAESPPFEHPDLGSRSSSDFDYFTSEAQRRDGNQQKLEQGEDDGENVRTKTPGTRTPAGLGLLLGPGLAGLASTRVGLGSPKVDFGRMGRHRASASPSEESVPVSSVDHSSLLVGEEEEEAMEGEQDLTMGYSVKDERDESALDRASGLPSPPVTTSDVAVFPQRLQVEVGRGHPGMVRQSISRQVSDLPSLPSVSRQVTSSTISDIYHISPERSPSPSLPSLPSLASVAGSRRNSFRPTSSRVSSASSFAPGAKAPSSSRGSRSPSKRLSLDAHTPNLSPSERRRADQLLREDIRSPHSRSASHSQSSGSPVKSPWNRSPAHSPLREDSPPVFRPTPMEDPTGDELDARIREAEEKIRSSVDTQRRPRTTATETHTPTRPQPRRNDSIRRSYIFPPIPERAASPADRLPPSTGYSSPLTARAAPTEWTGTLTTASASAASTSVRTPLDRVPSEDVGSVAFERTSEQNDGIGGTRARKSMGDDFFTPPKGDLYQSTVGIRPLGASSSRRPNTADLAYDHADSPSRPRFGATSRLSREYIPQLGAAPARSDARDQPDPSPISERTGRRPQSVFGTVDIRGSYSFSRNTEVENGYSRRFSRLNIDPSDSISAVESQSPVVYTPKKDPMDLLNRLDQSQRAHNQEWEVARSHSVLGDYEGQPRSASRLGQSSVRRGVHGTTRDRGGNHMRASTSMTAIQDLDGTAYSRTAPVDRWRTQNDYDSLESPLLNRIGSRLRNGSIRDQPGPSSEPRPRRSHTSLATGRSGSSYGTESSATAEHGRLLYEALRSVESRLPGLSTENEDMGRAMRGSTESTVRVNDALRDALSLTSQLAIDVELNPALIREEFNALIGLLKNTAKDSDRSVRELTKVLLGLPRLATDPAGMGMRSSTSMSLRHSSIRRSESGSNASRLLASPSRGYTRSLGGTEVYDQPATFRRSIDVLRSSTGLTSVPSPLVGRPARLRESLPPHFEPQRDEVWRRSATLSGGDRSSGFAGLLGRLRRSPKKEDSSPVNEPSPSPPQSGSRSPSKMILPVPTHPYTSTGPVASRDSLLSTNSAGTGGTGTISRAKGLGFWNQGKGLLKKKDSSTTVRGHGGFHPAIGQSQPTTAISQITAEPTSPARPMIAVSRGNRSSLDLGGLMYGSSVRSAQSSTKELEPTLAYSPRTYSGSAVKQDRVPSASLAPDYSLTPSQIERRERESTPGTTSIASFHTARSPGDDEFGGGRMTRSNRGSVGIGAGESRRSSRDWGDDLNTSEIQGQHGEVELGQAAKELGRLGTVSDRMKAQLRST